MAWAHPRACGENESFHVFVVPLFGSSPRVRGKPRWLFSDMLRTGLIPARAGKTRVWFKRYAGYWAHPRACGENRPGRVRPARQPGSSPRVRGKRLCLESALTVARLIPARAGKTIWELNPALRHQAHPRACGENYKSVQAFNVSAGSSPRVRGKQRATASLISSPRLIPARAGKTTL